MAAPVVRISLGTFDADKAAIVEAKLIESKAALESGIRAMRGNLGYYVGIDRTNNAMSNVSLWESVEAAESGDFPGRPIWRSAPRAELAGIIRLLRRRA